MEKIALGDGKFLYHISDRFFINGRDERGQRIWHEIPPGKQVHIGAETLEFPAQIFYGEERITINARDLVFSKTFRKGLFKRETRVFCNHMPFRAEPGTLTGIMGPSGAGKTVLLNLLSGYATYPRQCKGRVLLNGTYDVHTQRRMLGRAIGYVPQDDTLIPQLTVRQSLDASFRLRYSGVEAGVKAYIIRDACRKAGFPEDRLNDLLTSKIGSPEDKTLSGGERKRVNIAHELIRNPLLLFLDEPTSGLSSVDSDTVIASLKSLCETTRITIVLTIHQPSVQAYENLDRLLVVNRGGNIAYLGDAQQAVEYFREKSPRPYHQNDNPAEYILQALDSWTTSLNVQPTTKNDAASSSAAPRSAEEAIADEYTNDPRDLSFLQRDDVRTDAPSRPQRLPRVGTSALEQFWILLRRNHAIASADTKNSLFQVLQPVIIGGLMLLAFLWYAQDYVTENVFSRTGYYLTEQLRQQRTIFLETDLPDAKQWAYSQSRLIGEGAANRQAAVFFLLAASCIWFGIINACREIVAERTLLKREAKSILRIPAYLAAKVVFLGWTCCKQSALLLGVVCVPNGLVWLLMRMTPTAWEPLVQTRLAPLLLSVRLLPSCSFSDMIGMFGILALTSVTASWIGLTVSALAPTQQTALTLVPLIIFPQLLFGGLIRPTKYMEATQFFLLNREGVEALRETMPADILEALSPLEDTVFLDEGQFLDEVESRIGYRNMMAFGSALISATAQASVFRKMPVPFHHFMLQKWAFKALLLFHSLDEPVVLKRELDFDQPLEYQYLHFTTVHISDMFFRIAPQSESANGRQALLYSTLLKMAAWHAVILLGLTYFWLRRTLLR